MSNKRRVDYSRVAELAAAGMPFDAIANEIGASYASVYVFCRKNRIQVTPKTALRPPSEYMLRHQAKRLESIEKRAAKHALAADIEAQKIQRREAKKQERMERAQKWP